MTVIVFVYMILISIDLYNFFSVLSNTQDRVFKNTFPNTPTIVKNALLCIMFSSLV